MVPSCLHAVTDAAALHTLVQHSARCSVLTSCLRRPGQRQACAAQGAC